MKKKKIAFLCGAGCEGESQIELPSGASFKKDILRSKNISTLYEKINNSTNSHVKMTDGAIIDARSSNVLYQTFFEHKDLLEQLSDESKDCIEKYILYREKGIKDDAEKLETIKKFKELYKNFLSDSNDNTVSKKDKALFFENITLCSFSDELFNYLRKPELYTTEVTKIEKLYFSAYLSIIKSIYKKAEQKEFDDYIGSFASDCKNFRYSFQVDLMNWQNEILKKIDNSKNLYYSIIKEKISGRNLSGTIITTNYTNFAEKITNFKTAYIHGKIDWFEDIKTKEVKELTEFSNEQEIMPFIFIPSGVKPIINLKVIDQYQIAYEAFTKSDLLCILGYSINTDDEHIKNFIRERLAMEKKVVLFLYSKGSDSSEEEKSYEKMFESNPCLEILPIRSTEDFCTSLEKLLKDL
ncbi:hypothetical protein [Treponema sp.]|uniref:hypothetical protein n=1 Tax=Treponema sp. TaxID=166 RepID=UPI0025E6181B|nr:hypothetical protein [Treponema sp.]MBR4322691.1 hypothetical protein [Treponema sp.]